MATVPRHRFVPEAMRGHAHDDGPLPIARDQTISQPYVVAAMTQLAEVKTGARVLEVRGSFDDGLAAARELAGRGTHTIVNSVNPHRIEGQKTAAFEVVEELGAAPAVLALPYGGGGNLTAYAQGFAESGVAMPRMVAGESSVRATTVASAIRITEPAHAASVAAAIATSDGSVVSLSEDAILEAWRELAREEGVFCEPASAAGLAALSFVEIPLGATVVCVITGHGLKDPDTAARLSPEPVTVDPDPDAIEAASR